jgi:hypothetical protein
MKDGPITKMGRSHNKMMMSNGDFLKRRKQQECRLSLIASLKVPNVMTYHSYIAQHNGVNNKENTLHVA